MRPRSAKRNSAFHAWLGCVGSSRLDIDCGGRPWSSRCLVSKKFARSRARTASFSRIFRFVWLRLWPGSRSWRGAGRVGPSKSASRPKADPETLNDAKVRAKGRAKGAYVRAKLRLITCRKGHGRPPRSSTPHSPAHMGAHTHKVMTRFLASRAPCSFTAGRRSRRSCSCCAPAGTTSRSTSPPCAGACASGSCRRPSSGRRSCARARARPGANNAPRILRIEFARLSGRQIWQDSRGWLSCQVGSASMPWRSPTGLQVLSWVRPDGLVSKVSRPRGVASG